MISGDVVSDLTDDREHGFVANHHPFNVECRYPLVPTLNTRILNAIIHVMLVSARSKKSQRSVRQYLLLYYRLRRFAIKPTPNVVR